MTLDAGNDPERFWCVALGVPDQVAPALGKPDVSHGAPNRSGLSIWWGDQRELVRFASDERCVAIVVGRPAGLDGPDPADGLLAGYARAGIAITGGLGGRFCAVVGDALEGALFGIRDPIGDRPLFYVQRGDGVAVSPSPELLARSGGNAPAPDRLALAEWVITRTTPLDRTLYAGVSRVPPGHFLSAAGKSVRVLRYWSPEIARPSDRLDGGESLARFDSALDLSVARCAEDAPSAVFLSGGLDSGLVAAALAGHHSAYGLAPPLAITLKFPQPAEDEERVAREVAQRLGLPHLVVPLHDAADGRGILSSGIAASDRAWYPTINPWGAAYDRVSREAVQQGYRSALNGGGGNEVLEAPWELAGDLIRRGELGELRRFMIAQQRYHGGRRRDWTRMLIGQRGVAALTRPLAHRALLAAMPGRVAHLREARANNAIPAWALPDRGLRAEVVRLDSTVPPPLSAADLQRFARGKFLDKALTAIMLEGSYLSSRRNSLEVASPYLDSDFISVVFALPPRALQRGGHAKGLAYSSFSRRLGPGLAAKLEPTATGATFNAAYSAEAPGIIGRLGGLPRLADLGVVSEPAALVLMDPATGDPRRSYEKWHLLATEAWLQARGL